MSTIFDDTFLRRRAPQLILPTVESDTCCLCQEKFRAGGEFPVILSCGHSFGASCISTWLGARVTNKCPLCRKSPLDPCRVQQTDTAIEIPAEPSGSDDDSDNDEDGANSEADSTAAGRLRRSLTTVAECEVEIDGYVTRDSAKAVDIMATAWLLRSSPKDNAKGLAHTYPATMKRAYDAIQQALTKATLRAVDHLFPLNPFLNLQLELAKLRDRIPDDEKYGLGNKWAVLFRLAIIQSCWIDCSFSDATKIADHYNSLLGRGGYGGPDFQNHPELGAKWQSAKEAFTKLVDLREESRASGALFATRPIDPAKLERAFLAAVDSDTQNWEPQTPDFLIHLLPHNVPHPSAFDSVFSRSNPASSSATQATGSRDDVPSISINDARSTNRTRAPANNASQSRSGGLFDTEPTAGGFSFSNAAQSRSGGLFDTQPTTGGFSFSNAAQSRSGGLFGSTTSGPFDNNRQTGSGGLFGSSQPRTTGLFGTASPGGSGGLFGTQPARSGPFGNTLQSGSGGLFGSTSGPFDNTAQSGSGGLFGSQPSTSRPFGNQSSAPVSGGQSSTNSNNETSNLPPTSSLFNNTSSSLPATSSSTGASAQPRFVADTSTIFNNNSRPCRPRSTEPTFSFGNTTASSSPGTGPFFNNLRSSGTPESPSFNFNDEISGIFGSSRHASSTPSQSTSSFGAPTSGPSSGFTANTNAAQSAKKEVIATVRGPFGPSTSRCEGTKNAPFSSYSELESVNSGIITAHFQSINLRKPVPPWSFEVSHIIAYLMYITDICARNCDLQITLIIFAMGLGTEYLLGSEQRLI